MLRNGKALKGHAAVVVLMRPNRVAFPRLGMIVPKRSHPRAVDRNRIKRIIREWFRRHQSRLKGKDLIVRLGSDRTSGNSEVGELRLELERLTPGEAA